MLMRGALEMLEREIGPPGHHADLQWPCSCRILLGALRRSGPAQSTKSGTCHLRRSGPAQSTKSGTCHLSVASFFHGGRWHPLRQWPSKHWSNAPSTLLHSSHRVGRGVRRRRRQHRLAWSASVGMGRLRERGDHSERPVHQTASVR